MEISLGMIISKVTGCSKTVSKEKYLTINVYIWKTGWQFWSMNLTLKIEQEQQYKHLINRNKVIVILKNGQKSVLWKG